MPRTPAAGAKGGRPPFAVETMLRIGTVRTHLKRVLAKTGTHRQAQLVALLARVALPS